MESPSAVQPPAPDRSVPGWATESDVSDERPSLSRRGLTLAVSGTLLVIVLVAMFVMPVPYAIERPGPTVDTLGDVDGEPLITIPGQETHPSDGELRLTTVSVLGGPGNIVTSGSVLRSWLSPTEVVRPREQIFSPQETSEQVAERSAAQMSSSQLNATVAALTELGHEVPMTLEVAFVAEDSGAEGALQVGDVLTSITPPGGQDIPIADYATLIDVLSEVEPGQRVTMGIVRDGEPTSVDVVTSAPPEPLPGSGPQPGSLLGVGVDPDVDLPFEVQFDIDRIGGPSAGSMFALAIVELLTEGDTTGGEEIAGTGTVDLAGRIGPIGGIDLKMDGAARDGAEWFLAPAANCGEVVGNVPDGLFVVEVGTLDEANDAVEAIGRGEGQALPTCGPPGGA